MIRKVDILKDKILCDIKSGLFKTGETIYSRNKLSAKYNYSLTTINQAIKELTKAGYLKAIKGSRTYVSSFNNPCFPKKIYIITNVRQQYFLYSLDSFISEVSQTLDIVTLPELQVDDNLDQICEPGNAVIWLAPAIESLYIMKYLENLGVPQLLINRKYANYDYVATDVKNSIRDGISWLMAEHTQNITFISYKPTTEKNYLGERILAFYDTCIEFNLNLNSVFIQDFIDIPNEIADISRKLFTNSKEPKSIFVMHSTLAMPLVVAAKGYGFHLDKNLKLLVFDYIHQLGNYPGIYMLQQQIRLLHAEAINWINSNPFQEHEQFKKEIKTIRI